MEHAAALTLALVLIAVGFIGIFIPALPGMPFMAAGALVYGILDKFQGLSVREFAVLAVFAVLSVLIDHLSGVLGAKIGGASGKAVRNGFLGGLLGLIIFPPWGSLIGLYLGVFLTEYGQRGSESAAKAAGSSLFGTLAGMMVNAVLGVIFIITFLLFIR